MRAIVGSSPVREPAVRALVPARGAAPCRLAAAPRRSPITPCRAAAAPRRPLGVTTLALVALACTASFATPTARADVAGIVRHPDQLQFPPLQYDPPTAGTYRTNLAGGMAAYLVPDRTLPLVTVNVLMRVGPDLDPAGKEGLASMTMNLLTRSGTRTRTAKELEDRLAFLGAEIGSSTGGGGGPFGPSPVGPSESSVSISLLAKDLDEGLAILTECLKGPAWETDRIKLRKDQMLQSMKERNDDSGQIEEREWGYLMRGDGHWTNRYSTAASVAAITADDLETFRKRYLGPRNFVLAVSGDFDRGAMAKRLEKAFAGWPTPGEKTAAPAAPATAATPGWFLVDKDVNQGRVSIGLPAIDRYDPDYQSARIMNDVLGGGGFSSRLVNRIRSDEGLAYSVNSRLEGGVYYKDPWRIAFQSKVRSVAYAIQIALAEVNRMRDSVVTAAELELSKSKFIEGFPSQFETASAIATALATEEVTGRYLKDPDYFTKVRERIRAVTLEDVHRVARRLLDPSRLTVLMVGNAQDILLGDPKHDAQVAGMAGGEPRRLPLRDPMTMKPMATP